MAVPKITIDADETFSTMEIFVNDDLETTYSFDGETFLLSERLNNADFKISEYKIIISSIFDWINLIKKYLSHKDPKLPFFFHRLKKENNRVIFDFDVEDSDVTRAVCRDDLKIIRFFPRDEIMMNFSTFNLWSDALKRFQSVCQNF